MLEAPKRAVKCTFPSLRSLHSLALIVMPGSTPWMRGRVDEMKLVLGPWGSGWMGFEG